MTNAVAAPKEQRKTINSLLAVESVQKRIGDALGGAIDSQQFMAQLQISLNADNLRDCDVNSLYAAAHTCACLGLLPSLKQIAIIPRQVKENGRVIRVDADVMPQWQGFKAIMMRHPEVIDIDACLVHVNDEFYCDPTAYPPVAHRFDPFSGDRVFKNFDHLRGGYLVIRWRDVTRPNKYHFVSQDTIRKARGCAQTGKVWEAWFEEQCFKTVYRNAFARQVIPIDFAVNRTLERLVQAEDQLHGNDPGRLEASQPPRLTSQPPVSRSAAIANRMKPAPEPEPIDPTPEPEVDDEALRRAEEEAELAAAKERGDIF